MNKPNELPVAVLLASALSLVSVQVLADEDPALNPSHAPQVYMDETNEEQVQPLTDLEMTQAQLEQKKAEFERMKAELEKAELAAIEAMAKAEEEKAANELKDSEISEETEIEQSSSHSETVISRLKNVIPMPKPQPKVELPMHDWNVRLDALAMGYREANLEVDYYLNDFLSLGVMGRISSAEENDRYVVAGLRFNRFFKPHNQDGWFFSGQMYGVAEDACRTVISDTGFNNLGGGNITESEAFCGLRRLSFGMELLQSYQWIYSNGFNINVGLGGKYIFDIDNEIKEKEDERMDNIYYYDDSSDLNPWQQGIKPAMEASIGWSF